MNLAIRAETYKEDVIRMRQLLELPDDEIRKLGFTTPRSILLWDFTMDIFHEVSARHGYERSYVYNIDRMNLLIEQEKKRLEEKTRNGEIVINTSWRTTNKEE